MDRNVNVITDLDGKKIVLINDIRFKGKKREEWNDVEKYLREYVGEFYEIEENSEIIYIASDFPDEYAKSESRIALKGSVAKAKANASQGLPELIQIANKSYKYFLPSSECLTNILALKILYLVTSPLMSS